MWISLSTFFCSEVIFKVNVVWPHMTSLYTSLSSSSQTRLCADVFFGKRVVSHDFFHLSFWPGPKTTVDFCRAAGGSTCCCLVWWTQHWCGCRAFQWGLVAGGLWSVKNHWKSLLPLWVVHLLLYGGGGGSGGQDFPQSLSVTILTSPRRAVTRIYRFHPFLFSLFLSSSLDFSLSLRHISTHLMSSGNFAFQ